MPQAARSLPAVPAPPRLRAVPAPRGPSREVIRRRRVAALAALALLIALPLILLNMGGTPASDAARITSLLRQGATSPQSLCSHLSAGMLRAVGGESGCLSVSPARGPAAEVRDVEVRGTGATAILRREGGDEVVRLVREGSNWKVDDVR